MLCTNPILVRVDEFQKEYLVSIGEKQKDASNVPPPSIEVKEKKSQDLSKDQSVN